MEAQTIARQIADESGRIVPDAQEPEVDVDINIRDEEVSLFETESGRQFLRSPEMAEGVYVEPVPTANGFVAEVVVEPSVSFTEVEPARPKPQTGSPGMDISVRMD